MLNLLFGLNLDYKCKACSNLNETMCKLIFNILYVENLIVALFDSELRGVIGDQIFENMVFNIL